MPDLFNNIPSKQVPLHRPTGRLILIADEVGPGAYAIDLNTTLHPVKTAMIALNIFKNAAAAVTDEMERREIIKVFEEVAGIAAGTKPVEAKPIFTSQDFRICEHNFNMGVELNICSKCGRKKE